jgi:hypothetical protein
MGLNGYYSIYGCLIILFSQLDQQKLLLDKQRELKRAEINDMSVEIEKLKKELELLELRKKISSSTSD